MPVRLGMQYVPPHQVEFRMYYLGWFVFAGNDRTSENRGNFDYKLYPLRMLEKYNFFISEMLYQMIGIWQTV